MRVNSSNRSHRPLPEILPTFSLVLAFGYYYFRPWALALYPVALLGGLRELFRGKTIAWVIVLALAVVVRSAESGFYNVSYIYRFYFGFLPIYLLLQSNPTYRFQNLERLLFFVCLATIGEAVLVNTLVDPTFLPNSPDLDGSAFTHRTAFYGFYQRPFGLGGNPSVTSSLIVAILAMFPRIGPGKPSLKALGIAALSVFLCASGTGFGVFLFYLAVRSQWKLCFGAALVMSVLSLSEIHRDDESIFNKISFDYVEALIDTKTIVQGKNFNILDYSNFEQFFGVHMDSNSTPEAGGDFGWLTFLYFNGLGGLGFLLWFIARHLNRNNWLALAVLVLATFHYSALFSVPGQWLFAYALCLGALPLPKMKAKQIRASSPVLAARTDTLADEVERSTETIQRRASFSSEHHHYPLDSTNNIPDGNSSSPRYEGRHR